MLSPTIFNKSGVREINFTLDQEAISYLKDSWQSYVKTIAAYPFGKFDGRGIVMCAGGIRYLTCAWVAIKHLRQIGCILPIELWFSKGELNEDVILHLRTLNVSCLMFDDYCETRLTGQMLKPLSILYSKFKEVLFLDADNICIKDPSFLFETKPYIETGAIFWPDFWKTAKDNPIWEIIENKEYSTPEQESGQILINKEICWKELNLCVFFNEKYEIYHRLLWGDKDTFRFAWFALKTKFHMIEKPVGSCGFMLSGQTFSGNTMVQHCVNSEILFLHRNLLKWDITRLGEMTWLMIKEFKTSAKKKVIYCNAHSLNLGGDVIEYQVPSSIKQTEINCLNYLHDLRESKFYIDFFIECYIIAESK